MQPLAACHCCGLVHALPAIDRRSVACCVRCRTVIRHGAHPRNASRTAALAIAAILIYPLALTLPVMEIQRLGHTSEASIWAGMVGLLSEGHLFIGLTILLFSIVAPLGKLGLLLTLCVGKRGLEKRDRASAYKLIEFIGRWGMVDVLLVAVLVAMVKLGDLVQVTPGLGVIAFAAVVMLSLIASAIFDPHAIWEEQS